MMQVIINKDFSDMLKQVAKDSIKYEEENRKFLDTQLNMRGSNFLGVLFPPLIMEDYEDERYREWCRNEKYNTSDLLAIVKHFSVLKFDNDNEDEVMDSLDIDEFHNWRVEEFE